MNFIDQFKAALRASTPLAAVRTPDPAATIGTILQNVTGRPLLSWDIGRGLIAVNKDSQDIAAAILDGQDPNMLTNPVEALTKIGRAPEKTIVFFHNAHLYLKEPTVIQSVWNLRDQFKVDGRMLAILCPAITLPPELTNDVLVLDEPLPDIAQLESIVKKIHAAASLPEPDKKALARATDATCGLAAFAAEQVCAMSVTKAGLDTDSLWERKRQQIEQIRGCSVYRGSESFGSVRGLTNAMQYCRRLLKGKQAYRGIVFLDELGKMFAGLGGDLSGTTQEMVGAIIKYMQDKRAHGLLFMGVPGTCKSGLAKALGNEAKIPTIIFDCTAMKGSLVGETGANVTAALKMVDAVTQGSSLWIGTTNEMEVLPAEVRRRFKRGTFFFDIPTPEELAAIVELYMKQHGHKKQTMPDMTGWTGAEVESCCEMAAEMDIPLAEAAKYIVPVAKSSAEKIEKMRREASNRYLSASAEGFYRFSDPRNLQQAGDSPARKISVAGD